MEAKDIESFIAHYPDRTFQVTTFMDEDAWQEQWVKDWVGDK